MNQDQELIRRMLTGDERAFSAFFEIYFPRLYRFALPRLGRDIEACKEVVQATLAKVMRNLAAYRGEAALFTWMCQICRREIVDYLRATQRRLEHVVLVDDNEEIRAALESIEAPPEASPTEQCSRAELHRLIRQVLDRLPERYGDVLEWKYIEGRSVEEIGAMLGIGQTAAQSLLARARVAFRQALETVFGAATADVLASLRI